MHNDMGDPVRQSWAISLGLYPDNVLQFPKCPHIHLFNSLHEMAHLRQMGFRTHSSIVPFYEEAGADYFASSVFKKSMADQTIIESNIHARYFDMLKGPEKYWFAHTLDCLHHGKKPPSFWDTHFAVKEIRTQLASRMIVDADALRPAYVTDEMMGGWLKEKPHELLGTLKHLSTSDQVFSPLALTFAKRIVAAAEHFNPELTMKPYHPDSSNRTTPPYCSQFLKYS